MPISSSPDLVVPLLPFYVYVLMDPVTHEVLYCGKGTGTRVQHHSVEVRRLMNKGEILISEKNKKISEIYSNGNDPLELVIGRFETADEAFAVETTLIKWVYGLEQLTNAVEGHGAEFVRQKGEFRKCPRLDVPAPARSNDGSYRNKKIEALVKAGAFDLLNSLRNHLVSYGFSVRDFKLKEDKPFDPSASNGYLGLLMRIKKVDFLVTFSKIKRLDLSIANTMFSREPEALQQLSAIHKAKGADFFASSPKNIKVKGEGRKRDFSNKPIFSEFEIEKLVSLLHELEGI